MAREQRKDVDYFPHTVTHGRKMHIIEGKYGNDGYACWFKLLEQLGKTNNHFIDLSDPTTLMYLSSIFKIEEERTLEILTDLSKLGAIDTELFEKYNIIWSEKFVKSIEDAYRKRKQPLFLKEDILEQKFSIPRGNPSIPRGLKEKTTDNNEKSVNQAESIPKEKKRKEKESKENYISADASASFEIEKDVLKNQNLEKRKKVAPKKEKTTPHWNALVDAWFNFYKSKFVISPTFDSVQGKFFKQLCEKLEAVMVEKDKTNNREFQWPEDRAVTIMLKFLEKAWGDKWLQEHFLLKNILPNFDAIINRPNQSAENHGAKQNTATAGRQGYKFDINRVLGKEANAG